MLVATRRAAYDELADACRRLERNATALERHARDIEIQFKRIAQIQAEVDVLKRAWDRTKQFA